MTRTPYPEEVLGSARMLALKIIITLLSLGVAACCAYGMSKIDPRIVDSGLSVIDSIKVRGLTSQASHLPYPKP